MVKEPLRKELYRCASRKKALDMQRFFKTGPGDPGEGDVFIGVTVPEIRRIAREHLKNVTYSEIGDFVRSKIHEERLLGLIFLVFKFEKGDRGKIYRFYIRNKKHVNNWDLVDLTAHKIAGEYLSDKDKTALYEMAASKSLWERRIAVIATYSFIKKGHFEHTLEISRLLLKDQEDLIHKAVGWMLREIGKIDQEAEEGFLKEHYRDMPRTMLRYAIERFPEPKRKEYLKGRIG